jgi:predicted dienelactone hydrolase
MNQMSLSRVLICVAVLGPTLATADVVRAGTVRDPDLLIEVAGLDVAVWKPAGGARSYPLVLFSHGFGGCKTQSTYLMRALADDGMLVVAPDHRDKGDDCPAGVPEDLPPDLLQSWGPSFADYRRDDLRKLRAALPAEPRLSEWPIDPARVALVGHSLGGYTVLGLAGAWPDWKMDAIAAVVALAPFSQPLGSDGSRPEIGVPVLFQVGSEDKVRMIPATFPASTPADEALRIFTATPAPACIVDYQGAGHFAWTDLKPEFHGVTAAAVIAFLDEVFAGHIPTEAVLAAPEAKEEPKCK